MTTLNFNIRLMALFWLIATLLCLPVLIPMGLYVRKNTLRMPEAKGGRSGNFDVLSSDDKNLVFVGESPVVGVGVDTIEKGVVANTAKALSRQLKCKVNWQAVGVNSADIIYCIDNLLPEIAGQHIDYLVISLGVNDTKNLTRLSVWQKEITRLIDNLKQFDVSNIYFLATPDMSRFPALPDPLGFILGYRSRLLNLIMHTHPYSGQKYKIIDSSMTIEPSSLAKDGFHPSEKGCQQMGQVISSFIAGSDSQQ